MPFGSVSGAPFIQEKMGVFIGGVRRLAAALSSREAHARKTSRFLSESH